MYICSLHFERWTYMKKKLKNAAIPMLNLPCTSINPRSTQREAPKTEILRNLHSRGGQNHIAVTSVDVSLMTSTSGHTSQTKKTMTDYTPRKIKLQKGLNKCAKNLMDADVTHQQFLRGCEQLLTPNLNKIVKAQINIKPNSRNNSKMPPKKANLSARSREARRKRTKRALMSTKQNTAVNAIERIKIPLNQSSNLADTMLLNVKENAESLDNSCGKLECRACLENVEKANLIDIFQSWSTEQFSMGVTLADDLCKLTQVQISITDPHSNFICMPCHQKLLDSCIFIAKVQKSQQILNDRYNAMSNKNNWPKPIEVQKNIDSTVLGESTTVEIKQEVISEDEATDFVLNCDNADQLMEIKIEPEEFEEPEIESDVENKTKKPKNEEQALKNEFKHNSIEFTNPVLPMPQNSLPDRISDLMEIKVEPEESVEPLESEIDCETAETQKNQLNVGEDSKNEFNFDNTDSLNHSPVMKVSRDLLPIKITVNGSIPADQFEKIPDMSIDRHVLNGDEVSPEVCVKHEPDSDNDDTEFMNEMPLECMLCMKLFSSVSELKGHVVAQHSYVSVKRRSDCTTRIARNNSKYVCTLCKRSFVTSTDLMVHETCHDKYACYGCRNKYDTFEQLSNHTKTCTAVQSKKQQQPKTLEDVKRKYCESPFKKRNNRNKVNKRVNSNRNSHSEVEQRIGSDTFESD